ncbi:MAG: CoB--CoM heterodisulfide reductase iron-sulfur subunit A family protein, partial [Desulfamplus sp.]|nr:CoB--CoM heterodisulfide reductase iron-sulfur subunit A family protein [Desulfamplus sp.]
RFAKTTCFEPVKSSQPGVLVTGTFRSSKAIPRSVTEASAAAAEAAIMLAESKNSLTKNKVYPTEIDVSDQEPRIGVFVCSCGINISNVVNVAEVVEYAKTLPYVVFTENNLFTCSTDTQVLISKKIHENRLNRIVVAACSPRTHEPLFQDTLREAGLNGFLFEMANIRNHNSWVHQSEPEKATIKAKDQVRMAVAKVAQNYALTRLKVDVVQKAMVVGGGLSGMTAALAFGNQGYETVLIEKGDKLGGNALELLQTYKGEDIDEHINSIIENVENHEQITVLKNTTIKSCSGSVGNFTSEIVINGSNLGDSEVKKIAYGVGVIATGGKASSTTEYLFGTDDRVMTPLKFDKYLKNDHKSLQDADTVVFIQCVGSREPQRPYCSRLCCTHSVKSAIMLKEINPDLNVYILNRDIRTYGEREDLYKQARDAGVIFIRYEPNKKPNVYKKDNDIAVEIYDPILMRNLRIFTDYLVLATGVDPNDAKDLIDIFKFGVNEDGFLNEAHPKLRPVDMPVDGLFVAGLCNYPKPIEESVTQALACVSRAGVILAKQSMELDAIKSYVTEKCDGCAVCIDVCPYMALTLEEYQLNGSGRVVKRIKTDPALCKGCGLCQSACPKEGIMIHGFTLSQLKAQVDAALESVI